MTMTYSHNPYTPLICIPADDAIVRAASDCPQPAATDDAVPPSNCSEGQSSVGEEPQPHDSAANDVVVVVGNHRREPLRTDLTGRCRFVHYNVSDCATTSLRPRAPSVLPPGVAQLFLGQVPHRITDGQLLYVLQDVEVLYIERVIERTVQGDSNKGCIRLFVHQDSAEAAMRAINWGVLFDECGFWVATNWEQYYTLHTRCPFPRLCRNDGLPYSCAVLQLATPSSDRYTSEEPYVTALDASYLHTVVRRELIGRCQHYTFPERSRERTLLRSRAPNPRPAHVAQLFLGQVPFRITDGQLLHMFWALAGVDVLYIERVVQGDSKKGCIKLFVHEDNAEAAMRAIHWRVLFDEHGFWVATNWEQYYTLQEHCDRSLLWFRGLPCKCAVLERSTYVANRKARRTGMPVRSSAGL
jgi:hypothetical protein